jgi:hypothetical protein
VIKGKDWALFILKHAAKIAPKRSHLTARMKIWVDFVIKIGFLKIRFMNLFPTKVDRSTFLVDRSTHSSHSIDRHE